MNELLINYLNGRISQSYTAPVIVCQHQIIEAKIYRVLYKLTLKVCGADNPLKEAVLHLIPSSIKKPIRPDLYEKARLHGVATPRIL